MKGKGASQFCCSLESKKATGCEAGVQASEGLLMCCGSREAQNGQWGEGGSCGEKGFISHRVNFLKDFIYF